MQLQEKTIPHKVLAKPWKVVGTDIFMVSNENQFCIVDYFSKFSVVKKVESMLAEDLISATKVVVTEFGLPKNLFLMQAQILLQNSLRNFAGA